MAQRIMLTPEELESEASRLEQMAQQNDDVIKELDGVMQGLVEGWEGDAQRAFSESFNTKKATFQKLSEEMRALAGKVKAFASQMQAEENARASGARNLAG